MANENESDSDGPNVTMGSLIRSQLRQLPLTPLKNRRGSNASLSSADAQITDDERSDESIGETDEDVCFPADDPDTFDLEQLNLLLKEDGTGPLSEAPSKEPSEEPSEGSTPLDELLNMQIKSPGDLRVPFLPGSGVVPPISLPDAAKPISLRSLRSVSTTSDRNRVSFFGSKKETSVHAPELGGLVSPTESFSKLFSPANGVWWIDCEDPSDRELKALAKAFGIHPLTTDDIRTGDSREKFEMFSNYYFVCFHTFGNNPSNEDYYLEPIKFYILVFEGGVLTFHDTPVSHCRNVRRRARQIGDYIEITSDWICYALIDDITDLFAPILHDVESCTDRIEDSVFSNSRELNMANTLTNLADTRKVTMSLMRLLSGKADVVRGYNKRCNELWSNRAAFIMPYLSDIEDHILTMSQNLAAYEKILSRSHSNYMSHLQLEFVNASNRMTQVLSKATLLGTVLLPMNMVTGVFGINVLVPGKHVDNYVWFFGISGTLLVVAAALAFGANLWLKMQTRQPS